MDNKFLLYVSSAKKVTAFPITVPNAFKTPVSFKIVETATSKITINIVQNAANPTVPTHQMASAPRSAMTMYFFNSKIF